jgi:hypothetical protein
MLTVSRASLFCPVRAGLCYKRVVRISVLRKSILLAVAMGAWPGAAHANIGDTLPQLRARYGSASDMGSQLLFEVRLNDGQIVPARGTVNPEDHFSVTVYFDGVHSGMEIFTRNTTDPAKSNLTPEDIQSILNAAREGYSWDAAQLANGKSIWLRSDKKLLARFSPNKSGKIDDASVLVIMLNTK